MARKFSAIPFRNGKRGVLEEVVYNLQTVFPQQNCFIIHVYCVVSENIPASPTEGIFSKTPTPLEIPIKALHVSLNCLVLQNPPPPPQAIPIPSVGGVWIHVFSGPAHFDFQLKFQDFFWPNGKHSTSLCLKD